MMLYTSSNLFTPENIKYVEINNYSKNSIAQKNFTNGLLNARKLLDGLERSLSKSSKYEEKLLRCMSTHAHSHRDWWDSDRDSKSSMTVKYESPRIAELPTFSEATKPSRSPVNIAESWSTMSIVCLQYQYEELSKRYESLLHAFHDSCNAITAREAALAKLGGHVRDARDQLTQAHQTLVAVGEKYLSLCGKKKTQMSKYESRIKRLQATVRGVMAMCEHSRLQLDTRIARFMLTERNAPNAQLLTEIRKCNLLFLENLRLKARIEELTPGKGF